MNALHSVAPASLFTIVGLGVLLAPTSTCLGQLSTTENLHRSWACQNSGGLEVRQESSSFACSSVGGGTQALLASGNSLVWSLTSDGSWISQTVALGNEGTQVVSEFGSYLNNVLMLSSHDGGVATPVWSDESTELNFFRQVASAANADLHLSLHEEYVDANQSWRRAVLRCYTSASSAVLWEYESDVLIAGHDHVWTGSSNDGETVVLLVHDNNLSETRISIFASDSGTPVFETGVSTLGGFESAMVSGDGSALVVSSPLKTVIYDLAAKTVLHTVYTIGQEQYGSVAISESGSRVALGTPGDITVLERGSLGIYSEVLVEELPLGTSVRCLALSADGTTLVAGLQKFGQLDDVGILAMEIDGQEVLLDLELDGGGSGVQNLIESIECSANGSRFAVGLWGDEENLVPEVIVYDTGTGHQILSEHLPGSVNAIDFSPNGKWLAVASKGVHANEWGTGGSVWLYRVGVVDVTIHSIPEAGLPIEVAHHVRVGTNSQVLVSTALLPTPLEGSSYGAGKLYLDPDFIVELPVTVASTENQAVVPFDIPASASVGAIYYVQAVDFDAGELSKDWVKVTVLP
ncbi:MAG: WD40 repeat protein [Planctomycetota bacterium]|jgi:WD40 repeat protein